MLNIKKRDIANGDFLYGERIQLARILSDESMEDFAKIREVVKLLHDVDITPKDAAGLSEYVADIIKSFSNWLEREKNECNVTPTKDQLEAGFQIMLDEIGDMGGVVQLAEQRGWTFEQVLKLPYTEVFTIWKVQAANARYDQRYSALIERKSKSHGRHS